MSPAERSPLSPTLSPSGGEGVGVGVGVGVAVVFVEPASPFQATLAAARRFAPSAHLHVAILGSDALTPRHAGEPLAAVFDALGVDTVETVFDPSQAAAVARAQQAGLIVVGPWPTRSERARAVALVELASREGFDVLSVGAHFAPGVARAGHVAVLVPLEPATHGELTAAIRALPGLTHVTALVPDADVEALERLEPGLRALLPAAEVELVSVQLSGAEQLEAEARLRRVELLVVASSQVSLARQLATGLAAAHALEESEVPLLLLHRVETPTFPDRLVLSDTLALPGRCAVSVERLSALGRATLDAAETFSLIDAAAREPLAHEGGVVQVPGEWLPPRALALRSGLLSATARVLAPAALVLIDADFPLEGLADVEVFAARHQLVVVRLRGAETLEALRARIDEAAPWGGPLGVIDASAWLDDAGGLDTPSAVDALRLLRLAQRLVARGAQVGALVTSDAHALHSDDFVCWTASALRSRSPTAPLSRFAPTPRDDEQRWRWLTDGALTPGHAVSLELDNRAARARLLDVLAAARHRVHWQSYIVEDDASAAELAQALSAAAARGVAVRVLVDALYSRHDAFGAKNPLLERLAATPGVEVRGAGRLEGLPSLVELKQRNHRKLVIVDGVEGTVSGRNLGATYYRGFDELELSAQTPYRDVPWLDASVALRGPLVERLDASFLADWRAAGGAPFALVRSPPAGDVACRLVMHDGLRDANTLDALLELVSTARARVVLVNTFPLALELQRAVLRALGRGVQVQVLFGNVRPRWGEDQPFVGGALRELADELVRSRLDPLLHAGAEGWEFALPHPGLGRVFPHVHAKLYTRDADLVAVGSANLDVTSAYWESEALLLAHDDAFAARTLAQLDALLATSRRVDVRAPAWADGEGRREWLGRNWPNLMG